MSLSRKESPSSSEFRRLRLIRKSLVAVYLLFLLSAFVGASVIDYSTDAEEHSPVQAIILGIAKGFGICAGIMIAVQYILSARIKVLDQLFALNNLYVFHGWTGAVIGIFVLSHFSLMYVGTVHEFGPALSLSMPVYFGIAAAFLLWVVVLSSLWRVFLGLPYPKWLSVHRLAFVIFGLAMLHGYFMGDMDEEGPVPAIALAAVFLLWIGLLIKNRTLVPKQLRENAYKVTEVINESHDTNTLVLEGPDKEYLPGQFSFLTLIRNGQSEEEHPFTLRSSPTREGLRYTIKESGDYTETIAGTNPGDKALVEGPYGRFSYLCHPENDLLFIAGGVGITPIMSMLQCLADKDDGRHITLIWGNKKQEDIFFQQELDDIADRLPNFRRIDILSEDDEWTGEKGFVDLAFLKRTLTEKDYESSVFLCGPPIMMDLVLGVLQQLGFPKDHVHSERFSLFW